MTTMRVVHLPLRPCAAPRRCVATTIRSHTSTARRYASAASAASAAAPTPPPPHATDKHRRAVTPFNDDGRVPWSQLSAAEKAGRATQQTFNYAVVAAGIVLTAGVAYYIFKDVLSPQSTTSHFNRAVDRVRGDPRCVALLGDARRIYAHGDETFNKWRRSRPIASTVSKDANGAEHMVMRFYVEGPRNRGTVGLHMVRQPGRFEFEYKFLFLEVYGHERVYLEKAGAELNDRAKGFKMFGIKWF